MADQIEALKKLQTVDAELFKLRQAQDEKPHELEAVDAAVAAQEAKLKAADARLKSLQLAQKEKEGELQTREGSIKKLQGQLSQVKTNKEYTAMQHEIDTIKADNSLLEEAIIKTLDEIDQASKERQREQQKMAEQQTQAKAARERIQREVDELGAQISKFERDRQLLVPEVPKEALATYERVLKIREGLALVPVLNDACGGCNRRLPPQVINQVHMKSILVTCESCNRILYYDETHSQL